jgi:soluble lytic murein transglycosylase-like protein
VIPKYHQDKLEEHGGEDSVLDPMTNILVGTRILKDAMRRGGGLMRGLQLYAGAFGDDGQQYAQKVIAEKERLQQTLKRARFQPRA